MTELASIQSAPVPKTPQQVRSVEAEEKGKSTVCRARNREVTSRYKSSTPVTLNRRFPGANVDRLSNVSDISSPKHREHTETRQASPSRISSGNGDVPASTGMVTVSAPRRHIARPELLWPSSSTRGIAMSMECELQLQPLSNLLQKRSINGAREISQGGDHALRPAPNIERRKVVPEHKVTFSDVQGLDQVENAKPAENIVKSDNSRWPGSSIARTHGTALSKSVDLSSDRGKPLNKSELLLVQANPIYGSSRAPRPLSSSRALCQSTTEEGLGISIDSKRVKTDTKGRREASSVRSSTRDSIERLGLSMVDLRMVEVEQCKVAEQDRFNNLSHMDGPLDRSTATDPAQVRALRGTSVPARYWQETVNRSLRSSQKGNVRSSMLGSDIADATMKRAHSRPTTPASPESSSELNEAPSPPWAALSNQSASDLLPSQQSASFMRTSSYIKSTPSPLRLRMPLPLPRQANKTSSVATMLTFAADTSRRGKAQIEEFYWHRSLHNRLLQWRFVNARAEAAFQAQTSAVQKSLYNVYLTILEVRSTTETKRIQLQQVREAQKLNALVSIQAPILEAWSDLQQVHSLALDGSIRALESTIIRVPATGGVKVDTSAIEDAIGSAFDVMSSVENSVNYLLQRADDTNLHMSELASVAAQERALMEECADVVARASALQMEESSLRAHLIQMELELARGIKSM